VPHHVRDDVALTARREEDHHVPGHHNRIERAAEVHVRQVCDVPVNVRRFPPSRVQHVRVDVHADDFDAAPRQLATHAAGPAARIQHRRRRKPLHKVRFAVDVLSLGGAPFIRDVVGVARNGLVLQPAVLLAHRPDDTAPVARLLPRAKRNGRGRGLSLVAVDGHGKQRTGP